MIDVTIAEIGPGRAVPRRRCHRKSMKQELVSETAGYVALSVEYASDVTDHLYNAVFRCCSGQVEFTIRMSKFPEGRRSLSNIGESQE
jgi:hypothetical protein